MILKHKGTQRAQTKLTKATVPTSMNSTLWQRNYGEHIFLGIY